MKADQIKTRQFLCHSAGLKQCPVGDGRKCVWDDKTSLSKLQTEPSTDHNAAGLLMPLV